MFESFLLKWDYFWKTLAEFCKNEVLWKRRLAILLIAPPMIAVHTFLEGLYGLLLAIGNVSYHIFFDVKSFILLWRNKNDG